MTAQLVILAFGAVAFGAVVWFDRWQERQRQRRIAESIRVRITLDSSELLEGLRSARRSIEQLIPTFAALGTTTAQAGESIRLFGETWGVSLADLNEGSEDVETGDYL